MKRLALALAVASMPLNAVAGDLVFELGVGASRQPKAELVADNPEFTLRVRYEFESVPLVLEYEHECSIPDGPPLNTNLDDRWRESVRVVYRKTYRSLF